MEELCVRPDENTVRKVARAFQKVGQEDKQKLVLRRYLSKWKYIHFNGERVRVKRYASDEDWCSINWKPLSWHWWHNTSLYLLCSTLPISNVNLNVIWIFSSFLVGPAQYISVDVAGLFFNYLGTCMQREKANMLCLQIIDDSIMLQVIKSCKKYLNS